MENGAFTPVVGARETRSEAKRGKRGQKRNDFGKLCTRLRCAHSGVECVRAETTCIRGIVRYVRSNLYYNSVGLHATSDD